MGQRNDRETVTSPALTDDERRGGRRHDAVSLGPVVARLVGGSEVRLIDFSRRGVLLESEARLLIGARATIRITTTDGALSVRGTVVRSRVAGVHNGALVYHTALALEDDLSALEETALLRRAPRAAAGSEDAGSPTPARQEESSGAVLELLATVPVDLAELRRRAAVNNW